SGRRTPRRPDHVSAPCLRVHLPPDSAPYGGRATVPRRRLDPKRSRSMRPIIRRGVLLLAFLPFASCDSVEPTDPVPPELLDVMRHWRFSRAEVGNPDWLDGEWEHQLGGVVSDRRDWGEMM